MAATSERRQATLLSHESCIYRTSHKVTDAHINVDRVYTDSDVDLSSVYHGVSAGVSELDVFS